MSDNFSPFAILFVAGLMIALPACGACDKPAEAERILTASGYEVVETGGYGWFDCGEGDVFATRFTARRDGYETVGTVCQGWFKGQTIRFDQSRPISASPASRVVTPPPPEAPRAP